MERQTLDEQRCEELRQLAEEIYPSTAPDPPLPGTIVKRGDDLLMFGFCPARVLGNAVQDGFFIGYTNPSMMGADGFIEWPYAPDILNDRAPIDTAEQPMPVFVDEQELPPEQPQQAEADDRERQADAGRRQGRKGHALGDARRAFEFVMRQLPASSQRKLRDLARAANPSLFGGSARAPDLGDHRHNAVPPPAHEKG